VTGDKKSFTGRCCSRELSRNHRAGAALQCSLEVLFVFDEDQIVSRCRLNAGHPRDVKAGIADQAHAQRLSNLLKRAFHVLTV
jgi:hypothetical protein